MTSDSIVHSAVNDIKSIAIIGAGPSGAGALKAFLAEKKFDNIVAFERRSDFGGLWNYTQETDDATMSVPSESIQNESKPQFDKNSEEYIWTSPVYDYLDTNVPKDIMTYSGSTFPEESPIFPFRNTVLEYMREYAAPLKNYVRFNTKVVDVSLLPNQKWQVTSRLICKETKGADEPSSLAGYEDQIEIFDAVVIAVGNYDVPYIPSKAGMSEWTKKYPNSITHVRSYRNPQQYAGEEGKILIIGNSASANDLAYQLTSELKRKIYKSKRSDNPMPSGTSNNIVDVPDIVSFDVNTKSINLKDGSVLEDVSKIIFATGYLKSFGFLNEKDFSETPVLNDGHKVHGNYQHVILYNYPNLAVVGVVRFVLPTRTSETQGCWLAKIWSGKIKLPAIEEMKAWEEEGIKQKGNGKQFHDLIFPQDVKYCNELNNQILSSIHDSDESDKGLLPKIWDKEQTSIRGSVKGIKEAYIKYREVTGKRAKSYLELVDSGIIDSFMLSEKQLEDLGFTFEN